MCGMAGALTRCAAAPGHGLDACVQRRQVHRQHERPDRARCVIRCQQRVQIVQAVTEWIGNEDVIATGKQERRRMRVDIAEDRL